MNKFLKIILVFLGIILIGIGVLVITFVFEMTPDKDEEDKIKVQAAQYLEEKFNENFEIYDTLYDNMGNFEFEYAAKVREKKSNTEFLVYYNDETKQLVDTYIADKWEDDLENEIRSYILDHFSEKTDIYVYINENIGQELGIDPLNPRSYKEFDVSPTIRITNPRKMEEGDENLLNEFIDYLKGRVEIQHGLVVMEYIDENGVILDDEWGNDF